MTVQLFRGHYTSEAPPQTDEHVGYSASHLAEWNCPQRKERTPAVSFPCVPFFPLADQHTVRSPCIPRLCLGCFRLAGQAPAPLACMRWKV